MWDQGGLVDRVLASVRLGEMKKLGLMGAVGSVPGEARCPEVVWNRNEHLELAFVLTTAPSSLFTTCLFVHIEDLEAETLGAILDLCTTMALQCCLQLMAKPHISLS